MLPMVVQVPFPVVKYMSEIKLSICIATFKRAAFIGETLDSILPQCRDGVEVVVVDGASPDNTEEIVRGYQARFSCLRYSRQLTNKGVDEDFSTAVSLSRGEYCWLMSDDDLLKPGAVDAIVIRLKSDIDLVIVNAEVRNADLSEVLEPRKIAFLEDRMYGVGDSDAFFADTAQFLSFIGCVVIRRELWEKREKEKYFGTVFIHVGVIFQAPLPGKALVVSEPFISIRYGNAQWSSRGFEIWMFKWPELIWSFHGISEKSKQAVCPREPWRSILPLLSLRALGVFSMEEYSIWIKPRRVGVLYKTAVILSCLIPASAINFAAYVYFKFIRHSSVKLVDLQKSKAYWRNPLRIGT